MLGLVFYSSVAAGLGCLPPRSLRTDLADLGMVGIRFCLGYAIMVISVYAAHILLGISLRITVAGLALGAMAGFASLVCRRDDRSQWRTLIVHPAFLLIVLGGLAVVVNGGIGYLPLGNDEFSFWLSTPRLIHMGGGWAAVFDSLVHSHYTPGWQLTLLLPWQVLGHEDLGMSAAAPFVLHVTAVALIYDIVVFQLKQKIAVSQVAASLITWAFLLLFLAAEGMGLLWTYTLLIEQPQIYSYATVLLLIFAAETTGLNRGKLYGIAGIVLGSAYLYKVAALVFIPAFMVLSSVLLFEGRKNIQSRFLDSLVSGALLAGPLLILFVSWSLAIDVKSCSPLSLTPEQLSHALTLDWKGFAIRFGAEIWVYVSSYKAILTIAAGLGVIGALVVGNYRATLVLVALSAVYFVLLYVHHLTCIGETPASIPRFTRVPLQTFHALGLVMLFDTALHLAAKKNKLVHDYLQRRWVLAFLAIAVTVLAGWQGRMVLRSVVDTTTRAYQIVDPRIAEMHLAAARIEGLRGKVLPEKPLLLIISQGGDNAVVHYASYFSLGFAEGRVHPHYTVYPTVNWPPMPVDLQQIGIRKDEIIRAFSQADIIWPINPDPWLMDILHRLVPDQSCLKALPNMALVRESLDKASAKFRCMKK